MNKIGAAHSFKDGEEMSGIYSKGKALVEAEQLRKKVDLEPLEKAKKEFEEILKTIQKTHGLTSSPQWITSLNSSIQKALDDYEQSKVELLKRMDALESEEKSQLRQSILEVVQKANSLDDTFVEIRVLLSQIFRVVTADAELKRRTLENINTELAK